MARSLTFKIIIVYEVFEKFTAVIRYQKMAQWEQPVGHGEIVNAIDHARFYGNGSANDQPCNKVVELLEIERTPIMSHVEQSPAQKAEG